MKLRQFTRSAVALAAAVFLMGADESQAVLINIDGVATNITNKNGNANGPLTLVPLVWQGSSFAPSSNNAAKRLDWLDNTGTYQPGQIAGYNAITSSTLAQPGVSEHQFESSSAIPASGFSLTSGYEYYITAHYGGYFVAWHLNSVDANDLYNVPSTIGGVTGANTYGPLEPPLKNNGQPERYNPNAGISNVRIWRGSSTEQNVPEGGTSLALLGLGLAGLGAARRFMSKKA